MKCAVVNCDIYSGEEVLHDKAIVLDGKKIDSLLNLA